MEWKDASPSAREWEVHRSTIIDMYIDRKMSLNRLKECMITEYGFYASDKMYKSRLKQWGVNKKMNRISARANLIRYRTHGIQGLTSSQAVEMKKTMTYLRRLPIEERKHLLLGTLSDPLVASISSHGLEPGGSLAAPDGVRHVEDCLRLLGSYVAGSSENQLWLRDAVTGFKNEDIVPSWCSSIMSSVWVLKEGKVNEAAKFMSKFLDQCPAQLQRQDPLIFAFVYTSVLFFAKEHPGTAQSLLNAIYEAAERLPWAGVAHPLRLLLQTLRRLGPALMLAHAGRILLAYIDMIHMALTAPYAIVQDMLSDTMWRLLAHDLASPDAVADMGQRMVSAAVAENKQHNSFFLNLQSVLSQAYLKAGRYNAAREAAMDILAEHHTHIRKEGIRVSVNMTLCRVSEAEGKHEETLSFARTAIVESEKQYGNGSDWNVNTLILYRQVLERVGKTDDIQKAIRNRDKAIGELLKNTESLVIE